MFQWAQSTFDKLSQTVAPPPEDGPGRFAYCVQRGEEDAAMGCIAGMDPVHTVVNQAKGQYPIHLACQYSSQQLIQLLLNQPGMNIGQTDLAGNTPLHYASMSTAPNGLDVVKLLIGSYGASVLSKNTQGQTPYDVASMNSIRQHLLPIQLQAETQIALDNGGQGLPPGIDMGGLRINNPSIAPPPTFGGGPPAAPGAANMPPLVAMPTPGSGPPAAPGAANMHAATSSPAPPNVPAANMFGTPSPSGHHGTASAPVSAAPVPGGVASAPTSRGRSHEYSRVGSSSAAFATANKYRADGFHSSSSDVNLQKKYGHVGGAGYGGRTIAPPPSSGNSSVGAAVAAEANGTPSPTAPASGGPNPFAAGAAGRNRYGALNSRRYVAYGQVAGPAQAPAPAYGNFASPAPTGVSMFTPGGPSTDTPQGYGTASTPSTSYGEAPAPTSGTPSTPYMPPPPYQSHNYAAPASGQSPYAAQNSADIAEVNAQDIFMAPSPQKQEPQETAVAEPASAAAEPTAPSEAADQATSTPSDTWVEAVDPSSGHTYYYNTVTNETSWEKPDAIAATAAAPLPDNWVEATDPNSGRSYFYNSVTQETSWECPMTASSTSDAFAAPAPAAEPAPAAAPVSASDAFSASSAPTAEPAASAADAFGAPPPTETSAEAAAPAVSPPMPFQAPAARTMSADELFAEEPPKDGGDENGDENDTTQQPPQAQAPDPAIQPDTSSTAEQLFDAPPSASDEIPEKPHAQAPDPAVQLDTSSTAEQLFDAPPSASAETPEKPPQASLPGPSQGGLDEDGMMDDVPLSPELQRPVAEGTPTAVNGVPSLSSSPPRAAAPATEDNADSLFAAIGMPPPPFSARKR